ncbi:hypothetical protein EV182_002534 [Spiromyces aspiralis]|uniref:Uncharacterized protein n=1 Tax=Spiromyces aspiralis TaxID=68401 RepID=A0ACC1HHW2_9FUNG|nr:hypothetical protein EV182_002534 [Spiromyces aspiralis]
MDVLRARLEVIERLVGAGHDDPTNLVARLNKVNSTVSSVLERNAALSKLEAKYNQCRSLLECGSELKLEAQTMQIPAKAEVVLASEDYIRELAADLRRIEELEKYVNSPHYDQAAKLREAASQVGDQSHNAKIQYEQLATRIARIVDQYHTGVNVLSELFLQSDQILSQLEAKVAGLEAARL